MMTCVHFDLIEVSKSKMALSSEGFKRSLSSSCFPSLAPEIVENILSFLPARGLVKALLVCQMWKDVAERIIKRRQRMVCRLFETIHERGSKGDIINRLCSEVCEFLDNIQIVPIAVLVSATHFVCKGKFVAKMKEHLPVECCVLSCSSVGIIGETWGGTAKEHDDSPGVSILLIPKVKDLHVHLFSSLGTIPRHKDLSQKESWIHSFGDMAKKDVKFVFIVGQRYSRHKMNNLAHGIQEVFGKHVVVVGGIGTPFGISNEEIKYKKSFMGLAIGGNIHANSLVSHCFHSVQCRSGRIKKLFRNQERERSACFMIKCSGLISEDVNLENTEFRKMFPDFRLFGFIGNGEIGADMVEEQEELQEKEHPSERFSHQYATVFSVLTILDEER